MSDLINDIKKLEEERDTAQRGLDMALYNIATWLDAYRTKGGLPKDKEAAVAPLKRVLVFCGYKNWED